MEVIELDTESIKNSVFFDLIGNSGLDGLPVVIDSLCILVFCHNSIYDQSLNFRHMWVVFNKKVKAIMRNLFRQAKAQGCELEVGLGSRDGSLKLSNAGGNQDSRGWFWDDFPLLG